MFTDEIGISGVHGKVSAWFHVRLQDVLNSWIDGSSQLNGQPDRIPNKAYSTTN